MPNGEHANDRLFCMKITPPLMKYFNIGKTEFIDSTYRVIYYVVFILFIYTLFNEGKHILLIKKLITMRPLVTNATYIHKNAFI